MKKFIWKKRWGKCNTAPLERFSVKNPGEPVAKTYLGLADTGVRILKMHEIEELRRNGYTVEIIRKLKPRIARIAADIISGLEEEQESLSTFSAEPTVPPPLKEYDDDPIGFGKSCMSAEPPQEHKRRRVNKSHLETIGLTKKSKKKSKKKELEEEYLVLVKAHAELTKKLADFGRKIHDALPDDDTETPVHNIFRPFVDEDKLSDCFQGIFLKFFGALPTERLEGYYTKPIDLISYFFILVEWEKLGNYVFGEKCKKPFFEFVNDRVIVDDIGKTERTFHNRLTVTMNDFRRNLMKEPVSSSFKGEYWKKDIFIKDFLKVIEIFHGTEYYKELSKLKPA